MALTATDLFNDATTREIGGVGPDQVNAIVSDLIGVQQMLSAASPQINNLTDLHTHVIINQLNEEIAAVENANSPTGTPILGTDLGQYVGRAINDIQRDIIDIAQGDPGVQAIFNPTPLPPLNTPPAPFLDNATQTQFLTQWIQDSNSLGQAAITIENNGFNNASAISQLETQIQTFENNSNAFDQSQGGLFSARFWNELRADGTAGTAANALIEGLQTHNAGEVNAAAQQLSMNAADVAGNNLMADGGSYSTVVAATEANAVTPNQQISSAAGGNQSGNGQGGANNGNQGNTGQAGGGNTGNQAGGGNTGNQASNHDHGNQSNNSSLADTGNQTGNSGHHHNHHDQIAQLSHVNAAVNATASATVNAAANSAVNASASADNGSLALPAHADVGQTHQHFEHMWG